MHILSRQLPRVLNMTTQRFISGAGAIPLRLWIRTVTAAIPTRFYHKMAHILVSAQWLRTQCDRAPENWRFEYEYDYGCPPTLETGCALCGNQTTTTGQTPHKVTPSPCPLKSVGGPEAQTTLRVRTRLRIGVPGAEIWHSQETAHDRPHTDSNGVLAWYWESVNPNPTLTFPTQLNAAVPWDSSAFRRMEDVNPKR